MVPIIFFLSYNYNAYQKKVLKDIDVSTIYELGDEGIPYLVKLTKDKNSEVSELAKLKLSYSFERRFIWISMRY